MNVKTLLHITHPPIDATQHGDEGLQKLAPNTEGELLRRRRNDRSDERCPYVDYRRMTMSFEKYDPLMFRDKDDGIKNLSCPYERGWGGGGLFSGWDYRSMRAIN